MATGVVPQTVETQHPRGGVFLTIQLKPRFSNLSLIVPSPVPPPAPQTKPQFLHL